MSSDFNSMDLYAMSDNELQGRLKELENVLEEEDSDADIADLEEKIDLLTTELQTRGL